MGLAVGVKLLCRVPTANGVAIMILVDTAVAKIPAIIMLLYYFI